MPSIQGIKLTGGSPVTFGVPDGSPHAGTSTIWRDRQAGGTVELWILGAKYIFTRTGGTNGVYAMQSGTTLNAHSISDVGSNWVNGTDFWLTGTFPPFPAGLPPTNGYTYALRLLSTGSVPGYTDFLATSGDSDVIRFSLRFLSMPSASYTFTLNLYYQHQ